MAPPNAPVPRGRNLFKRHDVVRAVRCAEAAGLTVGSIEVTTKDGVTIRIVGKRAEAESRNELDNWMAKKDARQA
jgi:hypothetical protein